MFKQCRPVKSILHPVFIMMNISGMGLSRTHGNRQAKQTDLKFKTLFDMC